MITIKGEGAEVRWSYHKAATLGAWTLSGDKLTATIASSDPFKLAQTPLTFVVRWPQGHTWNYWLHEATTHGSSFTATVVHQEQ